MSKTTVLIHFEAPRNYGIGPFYYAVAVARKVNPDILISNWKFRRTCQSGVGRATGWIIPLNLILETAQVRVYGKHLIFALSRSKNLTFIIYPTIQLDNSIFYALNHIGYQPRA